MFPVSLLRAGGHEVDLLYFNPNIHPEKEELKRWEVLSSWAKGEGIPANRVTPSHEDWLQKASENPVAPYRCSACYRVRLEETAKWAFAKGYDCFTTTLLVSPYQQHDYIVGEMNRVSSLFGVPYLYSDFRVGYKRGREMARGNHMYMQKYCGCEFSVREMSSRGH